MYNFQLARAIPLQFKLGQALDIFLLIKDSDCDLRQALRADEQETNHHMGGGNHNLISSYILYSSIFRHVKTNVNFT